MTQVVIMACIGMLLILVDLDERVGLSGIGVADLLGALLVYRLDARTPSPNERASRLRRTPEGLQIGLRNVLPEVRVTSPLLGSATCFYLAGLLSYGLSWRYGAIAVGVGLLVLIPDGVRGLLRGGRVPPSASNISSAGRSIARFRPGPSSSDFAGPVRLHRFLPPRPPHTPHHVVTVP